MVKHKELDIDGTLFDSHGHISERTVNAIKKCTDKGIYVVFSTGRDYEALPLLQVAGSGMQYAITTNGSALYELDTRKCRRKQPSPLETVRMTWRFLRRQEQVSPWQMLLMRSKPMPIM